MFATDPFLALNIGNTHTTLAALKGKKILWRSTLKTAQLLSARAAKQFAKSFAQELNARFERVRRIAVASVVPKVAQTFLPPLEKSARAESFIVSASAKLPFEMRYKTPETLGADRIAVAAFVAERFPNQAAIVIDFGTAITYDVLTSDARYLGGLILAGAHAAAESLWRRAAQLPKFEFRKVRQLIGRSTMECLEAGLFWGKVAETEGLIAKLKEELREKHREPKVLVVATGGDAELFARDIPAIDRVEKDAALYGICALAERNLSCALPK